MIAPPVNILSTNTISTLSHAPVDSFLEYLRKQDSEPDESQQRKKRELAEQIQQNADKRKNDLQQTRLQTIADSLRSQDRRDQLDAIDQRKTLRREELDRKEIENQLDQRILDKRQNSAEQWNAIPNKSSETQPVENRNEPQILLGIGKQAALESGKTGFVETVDTKQPPSPTVLTPRDFSSQAVDRQIADRPALETSVEIKAKPQQEASNSTATAKTVQQVAPDTVESGKQMQMLASFSEMSGKLAVLLKQTNSLERSGNALANGVNELKGKSRPGFAELLESGDGSGEHSEKKEGISLDSIPLEKRPRKASPELLASLDAAFASKNRKKTDPQELGKDDFQAQLRQAESQQRQTARKADNADRPMLSQIERVRLVQRVANACLSASNQNGTIRMKLHPESLGSVSVKIQTRNKKMNIELEAETESVRSLLQENFAELEQQLQTHGMKVQSFTVKVRES